MGFLMIFRRFIVALTCCTTAVGCSGLRIDRALKSGDQDWIMYGGIPERLNAAHGTVQPPLEEVWQYNAQGGLLGSPLVRDSVMILGTLHGELQAVNLADGKRMGYKILESAIVGTPALNGNNVIVTMAGKNETVISYDLREGRRAWFFPAGAIESSPLIVGNNVYVTTLAGVLYCVDKRNGEEVWNYDSVEDEKRVPIRSSPSSDGKIVTFGSDAGVIFGVDASNGTLRWTVQTGAGIFATPVVVSGVVIVGNIHGTVYGVDASSGKILWKTETRSRVYGSASANQTTVFVGAADGILRALDIRSGKELWNFSARSVINSAPLVAGSLLYAGALDRTLYCLDSETGKEVWRFTAEGRIKVPPVLWGDILLVTSEDKYVTAMRPRKPL